MVKQVYTVKDIKEALANLPDDCIVLGSTVDRYENWYIYPVFMGEHPGAENTVLIQLKPVVGSGLID
jgi:hypothetical protein